MIYIVAIALGLVAVGLSQSSGTGGTGMNLQSGAPANIVAIIQAAAAQFGVDPNLALALAQEESAFNPDAVSSVGAVGLYQLMPATCQYFGVTDPTDPQQNATAGVNYLAMVLNQFGGDVAAALAALDWGPANVAAAISTYGSSWLQYAPAEAQGVIRKVGAILGQAIT